MFDDRYEPKGPDRGSGPTDLLHFVDNHLTRARFYGHLDIRGGAKSILDIVERGLRDRDWQFEFTPNKPY